MKKNYYFFSLVLVIMSFTSCTNDDLEVEPYTTGIIKFEYNKSTTINGLTTTKDTLISFTAIGKDPTQIDDYGYYNSSNSWTQMLRLNYKDFNNFAFIFFSGTDLDSLTFPYTFQVGDKMDAQINYVIGSTIFYDSSSGTSISKSDTYAATTYSDNFSLTIVSRKDNRLEGVFNGEIINQDGLKLNIKNGVFDIQIVDK